MKNNCIEPTIFRQQTTSNVAFTNNENKYTPSGLCSRTLLVNPLFRGNSFCHKKTNLADEFRFFLLKRISHDLEWVSIKCGRGPWTVDRLKCGLLPVDSTFFSVHIGHFLVIFRLKCGPKKVDSMKKVAFFGHISGSFFY